MILPVHFRRVDNKPLAGKHLTYAEVTGKVGETIN